MDRWLVETSFRDQTQADVLKRFVRKPVMFSGGGNIPFMADMGWAFRTKRAAESAVTRLREAGGIGVRVVCLETV
jgi:hypothetical protein